MKRLILCFVFSTVSISTAWAQSRTMGGGAGIYFEETLFPVFYNKNDTGSITTSPGVANEGGIGYDSRTTLGYVIGRKFLIGATYDLYSLKATRDAVEGGDSGLDETTKKTQYGPTIGYLGDNWRFLVTYFVGGEKSVETQNRDTSGVTGDVTITNKGAGGYQALLGYTFIVSNYFAVGPSLVYRSVTYSSQSKVNRLNEAENYSDTDLYSKNIDSSLSAMLSLVFRF